MATATLHALTQRDLRSRSATAWRHLLWKDWRQVWQLIVGITVIQAGLQLMMGVMEFLMPDDIRNMATASINVALAAPTLLAIGCSGILIGQERQNGSWAWSSSLPVSWRRSLMSKVVIWFASSTVSVGLLLGVAALALGMNQRGLGQELFQPFQQQNDLGWTYVLTVIIAFQVFIYFSLMALLIKDTLMAFVVAAMGLFAFHIILTVMHIESIVRRVSYGDLVASEKASAFVLLVEYALLSVVGTICLAVTYRWRWGVGQYAPLPWMGRTSSVGFARPQRAAWQSFAGSATQPSEYGMLLYHGFRSAMGLRVVVGLFAVLLIALAAGNRETVLGVFAACLASGIFGISVFSGDQTANRFRFFADRGVSWKKLLLGHVLPPALMATVCVVLAGLVIYSGEVDGTGGFVALSLCIPFFIVGMFSSLAFASSIISLTMAFVSVICAIVMSLTAVTLWETVYRGGHGEVIAIWFPVSTLIVLVVTIRLVPRWLKVDRLNATALYFATMLVVVLLPAVFGLSFGFLTIPKVEWQGTPLNQIKEVDWTGGPDLNAWKEEAVFTGDPFKRAIGTQMSLRSTNLSFKIVQQKLTQMNDSSTWFKTHSKRLEAIENGGAKPAEFSFDDLRKLNSLIEDSAVIALMATEQQEKEIAVRAWKANRQLIAFCQQPALLAETMNSTTFVWEIWNTLSDEHLKFLSDAGDLAELMPPATPTIEELRYVLKARAALRQVAASSFANPPNLSRFASYTTSYYGLSPLRLYPPIRWAYERQQAIALQQDLGVRGLENGTLSFFMGNENQSSLMRDPLLFHQHQTLHFFGVNFAERLRNFR